VREIQKENLFFFLFPNESTFDGVKGSAKFRLSEENTNKFAFLSVRNLSKSSEMPKKKTFFFAFALSRYANSDC